MDFSWAALLTDTRGKSWLGARQMGRPAWDSVLHSDSGVAQQIYSKCNTLNFQSEICKKNKKLKNLKRIGLILRRIN